MGLTDVLLTERKSLLGEVEEGMLSKLDGGGWLVLTPTDEPKVRREQWGKKLAERIRRMQRTETPA